MSQENMEFVRRWLAGAGAGPDQARAAVAEFCDADIDYYPARKFPEAKPCHGVEEFSQFLAPWREMWSRFEYVFHELIEVGDDRVLACTTLRGEGRGSGVKPRGRRLLLPLV